MTRSEMIFDERTVCCLCYGQIDKQRGPDGKVFWEHGHNPWPVPTKFDGNCCTPCNETKVIPARIAGLLNRGSK